MLKSLKRNKIFVFVLVWLLVISGLFYFYTLRTNIQDGFISKDSDCGDLPSLKNGVSREVVSVIDGDTFKIEGGHSVRIIGIDADERGEKCYIKAKNKLEDLILGKGVVLRQGPTDYDKYCRYLRHVFRGEQNVGLKMVKAGLAEAYNLEDHNYKDKTVEAQQEAKKSNSGCEWRETNQSQNNSWSEITPRKTGLNVIGPCEAEGFLGKKVIVEGRVIDSYYHKESGTTFLNFGNPHPDNCFTAVIFSSDKYKFGNSPEDYYYYKKVRIKGNVKKYQNKTEIILENPKQIEAMK